MDPLSVTASIISVLQLTSKFIEYLDSVKDAPKDRANLVDEASNLNALLRKLRYRVELAHSNEPWYNEAKLLAIQNGPLDQYRVILQQLYEKAIATGSLGKLCHALLWKFNKPEIENMIWKIERLKNHIHLALDIDHLSVCY
jgi:hypothetical protein